jgi:hypothetical protein
METTYSDRQHYAFQALLRDRRVPIFLDDFTSTSAGADFPGDDLAKAVRKLARLEVERASAYEAGIALFASGFVAQGDEDKAVVKIDAARRAAHDQAVLAADAAEKARPAAEALAVELQAEGREIMLAALTSYREGSDKAARAASLRALARNPDPAARRTRGTAQHRPIGGKLIDQIEQAVTDLGQPAYWTVFHRELAKWKLGQPAVDVFGKPVPANAPARKVRVTHAPGLREVGLVAGADGG